MIKLAVIAAIMATPLMAAECADTQEMYSVMKDRYGEERKSLGTTNGNIIEMWANEDIGSWTVLITNPNGVSCMLAAGQNYNEAAF